MTTGSRTASASRRAPAAYSTKALSVEMRRMSSMVGRARVEQFFGADQVREAARPRDRHVQSIAREEELGASRHVVRRRGRHREEDDRRLTTLELVHRADLDACRDADRSRIIGPQQR